VAHQYLTSCTFVSISSEYIPDLKRKRELLISVYTIQKKKTYILSHIKRRMWHVDIVSTLKERGVRRHLVSEQ
jgi:hypothetical protein